jgi:hypothetical protein
VEVTTTGGSASSVEHLSHCRGTRGSLGSIVAELATTMGHLQLQTVVRMAGCLIAAGAVVAAATGTAISFVAEVVVEVLMRRQHKGEDPASPPRIWDELSGSTNHFEFPLVIVRPVRHIQREGRLVSLAVCREKYAEFNV